MIDISWPLSAGTTSYKDRHPLQFEQLRSVNKDHVEEWRVCSLHMHAGTHVDAPAHMIEGGATIEQLSLKQMNGLCRVLDLTGLEGLVVKREHLERCSIKSGERILLKTGNSLRPAEGPYAPEVFVGACAAAFLAQSGIVLLGVDGLGLEQGQPGYPSHKALFNAGAIIVEGLRLGHVPAGIYQLVLLPLALEGVEAAPARAVLIEP